MTIEIPINVDVFNALKYGINGILFAILSDVLLLTLRRWADDCDLRRRGYLTRYYRSNRFLRAGAVPWKDLSIPWLITLVVALALVAAEFAVEFGSDARNSVLIHNHDGYISRATYSAPTSHVNHTHVQNRDFFAGSVLMNCSDFSREKVCLKAIMYKPKRDGSMYSWYCDGAPLPQVPFPDTRFYAPYKYSKSELLHAINTKFHPLAEIMVDADADEEWLSMKLKTEQLTIRNVEDAHVTCIREIRLSSNELYHGDRKIATCLTWLENWNDGSASVYPGSCLFHGRGDWKLLVSGNNIPDKPSAWDKINVGSGTGLFNFDLKGKTDQDRFQFFPVASFRETFSDADDVKLLLLSVLERASHKSDLSALERRIVGVLIRDKLETVSRDQVVLKNVEVGHSVIRPTVDKWVIWLIVTEFIAIVVATITFLLVKDMRWSDLRELDNMAYYWWSEKRLEESNNESRAVLGLVREDGCVRVTAVAGEDVLACAPPTEGSIVLPEVPPRRRKLFCLPGRRRGKEVEIPNDGYDYVFD